MTKIYTWPEDKPFGDDIPEEVRRQRFDEIEPEVRGMIMNLIMNFDVSLASGSGQDCYQDVLLHLYTHSIRQFDTNYKAKLSTFVYTCVVRYLSGRLRSQSRKDKFEGSIRLTGNVESGRSDAIYTNEFDDPSYVGLEDEESSSSGDNASFFEMAEHFVEHHSDVLRPIHTRLFKAYILYLEECKFQGVSPTNAYFALRTDYREGKQVCMALARMRKKITAYLQESQLEGVEDG